MNDDDVMMTVTLKLRRDGKVNVTVETLNEVQASRVLCSGLLAAGVAISNTHFRITNPEPTT